MNEDAKKEIIEWLEKHSLVNYKVDDDLTIHVNSNVILDNLDITELPYKFGRVRGEFSVFDTPLTSLKNSPTLVEKDFNCSNTQITSLEHLTAHVKGSIYCTTPTLKTITSREFKYEGCFFHCADKEEFFLPELAELYEFHPDFNFSVEIDYDDLQMYLSKYYLESSLTVKANKKKAKI